MTARIAPWTLALVLAAPAVLPAAARAQEKQDRDAAAVLKDLDALHYADVDRSRIDDPEYVKSYLSSSDAHIKNRGRLIRELLKVAPENERLHELLLERWWDVDDGLADPEFEKEVSKDFPDFAERVKTARRLRDAIGKPFHLEFKDAVTGKTVRTADWKGKIVAIDFWGTWCGPCNALMPEMKELYAKYKDQGVEFVGVPLNDASDPADGLAKVKEFVAKRHVPWPQFYQPEGFEGELVSAWGINAIPRFFVVDQDGNLVSTTAHGKLKTMLPELLAKAKAAKRGG